MKKLIASIALSALALSHTAVAAQSATAAARASSPVADSEELAGAGIWAVVLAAVVGIGIIVLVEENEDDVDDIPVSP